MNIKRDDIEEFIKNNEDYSKEEITESLYGIYEINNPCEKYVINKLIDHIYEENIIKHEKYNRRKQQLDILKKLELPEQRSKEWYEMRKEKLTASSLAAALDKCHFTSRNELILSKIEEKPYESNEITEWGVKYEDIAIAFYEEMYNVKVLDFGLIPHPEFDAFGASPDGICEDTGNDEYMARMVEIKCPPKRKFTKSVPPHYLMQVQGQLEVCDLDECDFFQVKIEDYTDFNEYKEDIFIADEEVINGRTHLNFPKGVTVSYRKKEEIKLTYIYPKLNMSNEGYLKWVEEKKLEIKNKGDEFVENKWWKITRYECTLVKRDNDWWIDNIGNILKFYNDLLYYRNNVDELKEKVTTGKKKTRRTPIIPLKDMLLVSDEED
jgi:putative phage-type endonuclease